MCHMSDYDSRVAAPSKAHSERKSTRDEERLIRLLRDTDSATRTLAAWTGGPIHLDLVDRRDDRLEKCEFADLDLWRPEPVQRRHVRLRDSRDRQLSEASATVVLGRIPYHTARSLRDGDVPLGTLLAPLHPRRHTISVVRSDDSEEMPERPLFDITARLDVGGRPVAFVRERYLAEVLV